MYFYPKDFTAGCTLEAKGFSELEKEFKNNAETLVLALIIKILIKVSAVRINKLHLLSDPDGIISDKYGSWILHSQIEILFDFSRWENFYRWISVLP